jgi:DMSO reductase anchor subunit
VHPALSVIVFTVASGAGYGLLAVIALMALLGWDRPSFNVGFAERWHGQAEIALALGLAGLGLLASTFHLGRPERAWRAFGQWRSSWLSREGAAATATFVPALALAWIRADQGLALGAWRLVPLTCLALALATLVCTGMIYANLKPIHAWRLPHVVPGYIAMGLASGALAALLVRALFGLAPGSSLIAFAIAVLVVGAVIKLLYWRALDRATPASTTASAVGLPESTSARLLDPPHTGANYLLKEMGFRVARKHARKLRHLALALGFAMPVVLALALFASGHVGDLIAATGALALNLIGSSIERWLFFAEARHTVMLYYGAERHPRT